ncbi:CCA tRNA nucleotidyltransferase, partial [Candidatus Bathyarchaeota archaeon]|nr:CCA tRNA nucleotidyltransferase [Candidatus Bathyarchaeota archaeon]
MSTLETVLRQVKTRVTPTDGERQKMSRLSGRLKGDVERILMESGFSATVSLQGSFARDTWVSGETDLDIFARFSPSMDRNEWTDKVLPAIKNGLRKYKVIERYAEHPFLEFHDDGVRVNIVPCYMVEKGNWKSATDRTPYHTEFMIAHLTPELRVEARLLKKFAKGIGVYGAEIKIGGFSGMLIDTLALYYHSFQETIRHASSWTKDVRIEIGRPESREESKKSEKGIDLIVIDPVDPDRNLAAAVRPGKLWNFVAASRQFLLSPDAQYFFPPAFKKKTRKEFSRSIENSGRELVAIAFRHAALVQDVLWGQLMKVERSLVEMATREEFQVFRSALWSSGNTESAVLLEVDRTALSNARLQKGPPVAKRGDSQSFLEPNLAARDTIRGPW